MKGIIIIEGADACGKTTLAKRLAFDYNGIIFHQTYRFKNKIPLYHLAILRKALKLSKKKLVILDRLHISEYIYGKIYRNEQRWPWMLNTFNRICQELNIPIIICLPHSLKQGLEWFNKSKNERPELYNDITQTIEEYIKYGENHPEIIKYNREDNDLWSFYYEFTKSVIEERLNK